MSAPTIRRSGPTCLHIFTLLSWISKPPFISLKSHSTGSTAGNCAVRSCQSCGFPQKYGYWGGKEQSPTKEELSMSALKLLQTHCRTAKNPSEPRACVHAGDCKIHAVQMATESLWFRFAAHLPPALMPGEATWNRDWTVLKE